MIKCVQDDQSFIIVCRIAATFIHVVHCIILLSVNGKNSAILKKRKFSESLLVNGLCNMLLYEYYALSVV